MPVKPSLSGQLAAVAALACAMWATAAQADPVVARLDERFAPQQAAASDEVPNFKRHVVPLLGRLGCNGRACHGSFQGRGGFRLSLFGYDFKADHEALTGGEEPRVDKERIDESLIIEKPTSEDLHEGGKRYEHGGWEYQVLRRWIESGAANDTDQAGKLARLEVTPAEIDFRQDDQQVQLQVIAHWEDGTREDVTPLCRFQTNDASVAAVTETGQVASTGAGDTHVVVFYDNGITPLPVLRPVSAEVAANYPQVPTPTKIDELVIAKLRKLGVVPSALCSDAEFLRRASLDMTGTLPTPDEVQQFLADKSSDKRAKKIDELLTRPGYAAWWTTKLCDYTGNNARNSGNNQFRNEEAQQWYEWIHHRVADNVPYDELAAGIVTATGREKGQSFEEFCREMCEYLGDENANFAENESMPHFWSRRTVRQADEKALSFAYAFLGVRLQCAQCHKHPFDQWSKEDFQEFSRFFAGIQYGTPREDASEYRDMLNSLGLKGKKGGQLRKMIPQLLKQGKVVPFREVYVSFNDRGGRRRNNKNQPARNAGVVKASLLGGETLEFKPGDDPREALMQWMRKADNPYFAKAFVNRVWAGYFNVGIVEPPDDMNLANPPSNAPLLDWLTEQFIAHDFDMKWLHRTIVSSRTYQLSWQTNETNRLDARNFSHAVPRRLPAELVYDALRQATASDAELAASIAKIDDRAIGPKSSMQNGGGRRGGNYLLTTFGKPARETNCDCERSVEPSLLQVLFLRNDNEMLGLIERRDGWLNQVARENKLAFTGVAAPGNNGRAAKNQVERVEKYLEQLDKKLRQAKKGDNKRLIARLEQQKANGAKRLAAIRKRGGGNNVPSQRPAATAQASPKTPVSDEVAAKIDDWIRTAYLRSLNRLPGQRELSRAHEHVAAADTPMAGLRDVFWALLNTKEFVTNH